jgi:hypothetical protein
MGELPEQGQNIGCADIRTSWTFQVPRICPEVLSRTIPEAASQSHCAMVHERAHLPCLPQQSTCGPWCTACCCRMGRGMVMWAARPLGIQGSHMHVLPASGAWRLLHAACSMQCRDATGCLVWRQPPIRGGSYGNHMPMCQPCSSNNSSKGNMSCVSDSAAQRWPESAPARSAE